MKKVIAFFYLILFSCFAYGSPYGDPLDLRVIADSHLWESTTLDSQIDLVIKKEDIVKSVSWPTTLMYLESNKPAFYTTRILHSGSEYYIPSNVLAPTGTQTLLENSWLTNVADESRPYWLSKHYLHVLLLRNRDSFYQYEKEFIDESGDPGVQWERGGEWYVNDNAGATESLQLTQNSIIIGGFIQEDLWILNVQAIKNGYQITTRYPNFESKKNRKYIYNKYITRLPLDRESFDIFLVKDGDYIDMYLDEIDNYITSFVKVDKTIVDEINNLIKTNNCNFSGIVTWPRRADGSMDYPPPQVTQATISEQPKTVIIDTPAEDGDAVVVTPAGGMVVQLPGIGLPLIVVLAAAGIAIAAGAAVFLIRRKR
jgi:hypothetical protein